MACLGDDVGLVEIGSGGWLVVVLFMTAASRGFTYILTSNHRYPRSWYVRPRFLQNHRVCGCVS